MKKNMYLRNKIIEISIHLISYNNVHSNKIFKIY